MNRSSPSHRWAALMLCIGAVFAVFFLAVRPWYLHWGVTQDEALRSLPGDEIVPEARTSDQATRAITIAAPSEQVWPWLAQLGQDRGGFYSFEVLEDLVGCRMTNADEINPRFQTWRLGDKLWMYPPERLNGMGHAVLAGLEPGRMLGFATRQIGTPEDQPYDGSWTFVLEPLDPQTTRLWVRGRAAGERGAFWAGFDHVVFEPIHFMMERKMLTGIKLRAEGGRGSYLEDTLQPVLWTVLAGLMIISAVLCLRRRERWTRALVGFVLAAGTFQLLSLGQPPLAVGVLLVLAVMATVMPGRTTSSASTADPRTVDTRRRSRQRGNRAPLTPP